VRDKTLYFRPPTTDASPDLSLSLGEDVIEFTPRMSSLGQIGEVRVRGWDVSKKQAIVGAASAGMEPGMGGQLSGPKAANKAFGRSSTSTVDVPLRTKAEADAIALGRFLNTALSYVRGDLVVHGNARLHAGMVVNVAGAGRTFSGPYYVTSARHETSAERGYRTTLTVQRTAT
jgi:phage protein D